MTATLAGIAVERGLLQWDSDARELLGGGTARGATLERLLSHTAGIRALTEDAELVDLPADRLALAQMLLDEEPLFAPGSDAAYSNGGYAVASALLEQAFACDFETALTGEVFEPLGLDAGFGWPKRVVGHYWHDGVLVPHDRGDGYALGPPLTAAGDVSATIDSYARFVQLHLRGLRGEAALLTVETFAKLHTPVIAVFALGWGIQEWEGARTSVLAGSAETYFAIVAVQPERDFAAVALLNAAGDAAERSAVGAVRRLVQENADA
jgi:CubicO group peptidase (beta-lactamase class C family)